jgi:hypothetical protein
MKNILDLIFRPNRKPLQEKTPASSRDNPATIADGSENATRRQLVHVLLRDLLRKSGIPAEWIECRMLVVASHSKGSGMFVRLVLKHWDARFMDYAPAFQNTLLTDIHRFDPDSTWLHGISWELEPGDSCPYTVLPEKSYWLSPVKKPVPEVAAAAQAPAPILAPKLPIASTNLDEDPGRDLEALFAIRDQELERQAVEGLNPVGYEKTQPSPL